MQNLCNANEPVINAASAFLSEKELEKIAELKNKLN